MSNDNINNIKAIYQLATVQEQTEGNLWYHIARAIACRLALKHDITEAQAIGVIAALSPRNKWERNVQDADSLITAFKGGGAAQAQLTKVCTFGANKTKAIKILESGLSRINSVLTILSGPKLREFAACIYGQDDVCIDGHAYCIWNGGRTSLADVPAIGVKLRKQIKADYIKAAADLGLTPAACQAITWVAWRRIHGVTK